MSLTHFVVAVILVGEGVDGRAHQRRVLTQECSHGHRYVGMAHVLLSGNLVGIPGVGREGGMLLDRGLKSVGKHDRQAEKCTVHACHP